uniref:Homeobox-leucine zipper protein ROC2 n=1 Tax=Anthurium amnicola TaxID=1678845 RepID=A0A1D1Z2W3_9ARAE
MPAGIMVPARQVPPLMGRNAVGPGYGSTSGLSLGQPSILDATQHYQQQMDINPVSAESEMARIRDEEFESKSGSDNVEGASGDDQEPNQRPKKKRYHRHTQHQIQEMEAFFKECPHPDDKQRKELSRDLGLEPLQVKFWFQNKRTQMKNQHERQENQQLKSENDKLRAENMRYKEALSNASCPNCGGPTAIGEMSFDEQQLRIENVRLREEIDRISGIAAKYVSKPMGPYPLISSQAPPSRSSLDLTAADQSFVLPSNMAGHGVYGPGEMLRAISLPNEVPVEKPVVVELAVAAMEELTRMAQAGEPLWVPDIDGGTEVLNEEEYVRAFPRGIGPRPIGLKAEASRQTAIVIMNVVNLVEILMDMNQWSMIFSSIVSRATTLEVLSTGVAGNYNGALQVMTAEFQMPSPLVPTRDSYFVRYCKQHTDGTWAVVDVSLDGLHPNPVLRCRRRPSGCLIQEMPNGYAKVTWVEHVEVDDRTVHSMYRPLVNSGLAFGADRWVSTLDRQCERLASVMASNMPNGEAGVITSQEGRKSMLKLAERMVISFCSGVSASVAHQWTTLSGACAEDVRVMTKKSVDDPGRPPGIVLSAATSFWLPVPPKRVFDFLRDENTRNEWDILSNGGIVHEMAHIANGRDEGNCVSLLRVNSTNSNQSNMLILQESCADPTGSYVIYAPVDLVAMNVVLNGGDPEYVALLPSGFAILPDGPPTATQVVDGGVVGAQAGTGGSLLTVAFQILVDSQPNAKLSLGSVATVNSLIACTVDRIKSNVLCEGAH